MSNSSGILVYQFQRKTNAYLLWVSNTLVFPSFGTRFSLAFCRPFAKLIRCSSNALRLLGWLSLLQKLPQVTHWGHRRVSENTSNILTCRQAGLLEKLVEWNSVRVKEKSIKHNPQYYQHHHCTTPFRDGYRNRKATKRLQQKTCQLSNCSSIKIGALSYSYRTLQHSPFMKPNKELISACRAAVGMSSAQECTRKMWPILAVPTKHHLLAQSCIRRGLGSSAKEKISADCCRTILSSISEELVNS
jgi:hypothetical protein